MLLGYSPPARSNNDRVPCETALSCRRKRHTGSGGLRPQLLSGPTETRPRIPSAKTPVTHGQGLCRHRRSGDVPSVLRVCYVSCLSSMLHPYRSIHNWCNHSPAATSIPCDTEVARKMKSKGRMTMTKLEGKVAVITGGNSGIGLATAQRFVAEGAYVFITGRRQSELDAAVKQIGRNVTGGQGDVSKLADLDKLYATVKKEKGHLDILFANAGGGELAPLDAITEEQFDKTF